MNYLLFLLFHVGLSLPIHKVSTLRTTLLQPLNNQKNTPYGTLESVPLSDIYKGLHSGTIRDIYISDDMKDIYFLGKDETSLSRIVHSNPSLTENIVEFATSKDVKTIILEPDNGILAQGGKIAGGILDFIFIGVALTIVLNVIRSFFRGSRSSPTGIPGGVPFDIFKSVSPVDKTTIKLTDWAGSPEVFEECFEIVSYIKNSSIYEAAGATIPKGILLEGPPGTGKTLLAKAIAGETNATFISVSGSEFVELFVGAGASKVRQLFEQARMNAPSIIFIDEIDAVGKKRSVANLPNSNDEREQTLNQILYEMDGFKPNTGVLVLAATNRRDVLDDALLRPGRFDRLIYVPLPDLSSREKILNVYLQNKITSSEIDIKELAEATAGFSGAQLKNLLNEAAIMAARNGSTIVTKENMEDAIEKIVVGITKKTDMRSLAARTRVAIHELGHAILAAHFRDEFDLKKVSLKSTYDGVGGFTLFQEKSDIKEAGLYTKDLMIKRIIVALGGKAAETLAYGEFGVSLGSSQDLLQANDLARQMVEKFGMGELMEAFSISNNIRVSDKTLETVDDSVFDIVKYGLKEAERILIEHKSASDKLLIKLLAENVINGQIVSDIVFE
jgi:cell division protease FtsH